MGNSRPASATRQLHNQPIILLEKQIMRRHHIHIQPGKGPLKGMQMWAHGEVAIGWCFTRQTSLRLQADRTSLYDMTHPGSGAPEFTS